MTDPGMKNGPAGAGPGGEAAAAATQGGDGNGTPPIRVRVAEMVARGIDPVRIPPGKKHPVEDDWPDLKYPPESFRDGDGVGVKLGAKSGGLVDVDCDWPEARDLADELLSHLPSFGHLPSAPRSHRVAVAPGVDKVEPFALKAEKEREAMSIPKGDRGMVVELRGGGGQTVFPGGRHAGTGEPIEWTGGAFPAEIPTVESDDVRRAVGRIAALSVVLRAWPKGPGDNNNLSLPLSGALLSAGMTVEDADRAVRLVCRLAGDPDWATRSPAARTKALMDAGEDWQGLPRLCDDLGIAPLLPRLSKWLGVAAGKSSGAGGGKKRRWGFGDTAAAVRAMGVSFHYDDFAHRVVLVGMPAGFGPDLDDAAVDRFRRAIQDAHGAFPGKEDVLSAIEDAARAERRNPVLEYLDSCSRRWFDEAAFEAVESTPGGGTRMVNVRGGRPRLDRWLTEYLGVPETPLSRAFGTLWLAAAARRARLPGSKFDEMLVLEGPEGMLKSEALRVLAARDEWFTDGVILNGDAKVAMEVTEGKWICESADLSGMRKADVEKVKAYLSRRTDRSRLAYARRASEWPRSCVFAGTTNDSAYLRSRTGNRRFWPVRVGRVDLAALARDRDLLWGEASAYERAWPGEIRLDSSLWEAAAEEQDARTVKDEDGYLEVLTDALGAFENGSIPRGDANEILGARFDANRDREKIAARNRAAARLGWEPKEKVRFAGKPLAAFSKGTGEPRLRWDPAARCVREESKTVARVLAGGEG